MRTFFEERKITEDWKSDLELEKWFDPAFEEFINKELMPTIKKYASLSHGLSYYNNNHDKLHQSQAAISFSAIILVGFIRTRTRPSSLFLLPYASALSFPIYRSAILVAHFKTSFCL